VDILKLMHALFDASEIVERLEKRLRLTFANLEDVSDIKTWAVTCLQAMLKSPVPGGTEETFLSSLQVQQEQVRNFYCSDISIEQEAQLSMTGCATLPPQLDLESHRPLGGFVERTPHFCGLHLAGGTTKFTLEFST